MFGSETAGAVALAQNAEGADPTGAPDEETFAALSRACSTERGIVFAAGSIGADVAGNAAPGDPDRFSLWLIEGQELTVRVWSGVAVEIAVSRSDGVPLMGPEASGEVRAVATSSQMHVITVTASAPTSYAMTVEVPPIAVPGSDLTDALEALFEAVNAADIEVAMASIADDVIYHDREQGVHSESQGARRLAEALTLLSQGPDLVSLGVSGADGDLITFEASTVQEDPDLLRFAARVSGGTIIEWWDQPDTIEDTLGTVFVRSRLGDIDGVMTLFAVDELTFHRRDGMVFEGAEARSALRRSFVEAPPLVFGEITEYVGARAEFEVASIGADPEFLSYAALFNGGIGEWWEIPPS
jgi:hypothetical protein